MDNEKKKFMRQLKLYFVIDTADMLCFCPMMLCVGDIQWSILWTCKTKEKVCLYTRLDVIKG